MAMLILSVWSQNGWLPCGWVLLVNSVVHRLMVDSRHALRMGLDINLHRALDKLADGTEARSDYEERDLGQSSELRGEGTG